ncbi:hypothetical protein OHB00_06890 [Streptomyces sp. NBC_00631]|uniref:hypothetical protein n=1 Tax=Streptomyces sp. NBC_00631 TaxID=2975793 RepID=UPI0030DE51F5
MSFTDAVRTCLAPARNMGRLPSRTASRAAGMVVAAAAAAPTLAAPSIVFWEIPRAFGPYERL